MSALEDAARDIVEGAQAGKHFPDRWMGRFSLEEGYRVQLLAAAIRAEAGDAHIGWKVGLTAKAIQEMEGFDEPIFACLFQSGRMQSGERLPHRSMIDPAFENELCITLGAPLAGPNATAAGARAAVAMVAPALEIVERRGALSSDPPLGVADNLGQKAFVTGRPVRFEANMDLAATTCAATVNGQEVASGTGAAVLGDPLESVAWLANKLSQFGRRIEAGAPIMTGSFTLPTALNADDAVVTRFDPLGDVAIGV